jgi:two-component system, chemotaxis family, chemotaxis protein CheY
MNMQPTVLLADDADMLREIFKPTLALLGCNVIAEAATEKEAISQYDHHRPDLTLLDIRLSIGDGVRALDAIRELNRDAYVVMMTAVEDPDTEARCDTLGAKGYIIKGRSVEKMISEIEPHLEAIGSQKSASK